MTLAACRIDFVPFDEWCEDCQITFLQENVQAEATDDQPAAIVKISPLSERFPAPQSEMTQKQINAHNEKSLGELAGFPGMVEGIVEEPVDATPQHVGANGGGV